MDDSKDLPQAFSRFREMGLERISCIGGRTLATQLLDAGLVQDVYLTTSAQSGGEPNTPMYPKPLHAELVVRKMGTDVETGVVFEHRRIRYVPKRNSFMNITVA
jgi:dihydrofolate reductase